MRPKILLLDTIAAEGMEVIEAFADVCDGRKLNVDEQLAHIGDFDGLVIKSGNRITRAHFDRAKRLKVIGRAGSGVDNIDMMAAKERGVTVITSPEGNACSVAEHVVCTAILLCHQLLDSHRGALHNDFRRATWQGRNLAAMNVGIVGAGHIGRVVVQKMKPLCKQIYIYDPYIQDWQFLNGAVEVVPDLHTLLSMVELVTLHVPLTSDTRGLMNDAAFERIKKGSILINTARGEVVDDAALVRAMESGVIEAAALDALHPDPPFNEIPSRSRYSHFWVHHPKVFYTPHIAAGTKDALRDVATHMARKMGEFFYSTNWKACDAIISERVTS